MYSWYQSKSIITILTLSVLFFGLAALAYGQHGSWHDHYQSASGISCCARNRDCQQMVGRLVGYEGEYVRIEVDGVLLTVHPKSVHASEDGAFWLCRTSSSDPRTALSSEQVRCVFLATGG